MTDVLDEFLREVLDQYAPIGSLSIHLTVSQGEKETMLDCVIRFFLSFGQLPNVVIKGRKGGTKRRRNIPSKSE